MKRLVDKTTTTYTLAEQIASAARYGADAKYHCAGDIVFGSLVVTPAQWDHLPQRAKALGARWEQHRGHDHLGRPSGDVVAADGSRCRVVRGAE